MTISNQEEDIQTRIREGRIAFIIEVLKAYSPSGSEQGVAKLIFNELCMAGLKPLYDKVGNVICSFGPDNGERKSVLLCGHMDTVPGELPVQRSGDLVYGRGACDAKGPLLSLLFAFEDLALRHEPEGLVTFAAVTEEERSSLGLRQLITDNVKANYAIFGEPCGLSKVTVSYRGHLPTKITVETEEAHGSAPWLAQNSAELSFALYERIKKSWRSEDSKVNSIEDVSVALTEIHGGSVHNVTPLRTTITLDIRIPNRLTLDSVKSTMEKVVEEAHLVNPKSRIDIEYGEPTEPYKAKLDSELVRAISRTMLKSDRPIRPNYVEKSGTGDMNTYAKAFGVQAVTYGPGDTKLSHTSAEVVNLSEVFGCADIVVRAIQEALYDRSSRSLMIISI